MRGAPASCRPGRPGRRPGTGLVLLLIALATGAAADQRPLEEMRGDCRDYRMKLGPEFSAWRRDALPREAAGDADAALERPLSLTQRYVVQLRPVAELSLPRPDAEGETADAPSGQGGLLAFRTPANGFYRICLGDEVQVDLLSVGRRTRQVAPREFEMQSACETVYKCLEYMLRGGRSYVLQLSGAQSPVVEIQVTARR